MVVAMNQLAKAHPKVRIASVDPGGNKTNMTSSDAVPGWLKPFAALLFSHPSKGAQKLYEAAFSNKFPNSGIYIANGKARPMKFAITESDVAEMLKVD